MKTRMRTAMAAIPIALALVLAGCTGGGDDPMSGMDHEGPTHSGQADGQVDVGAADSMFVMMMIPHHQQAVEMSDMVLGKTGIDPEVTDLAQQIRDAQAPEIETMESWLRAWGLPLSGQMGGMDHGDGMMSDQDMAELSSAEGDDASRLFLEQMIVHHEGAVDMAEAAISDAENEDVLELAETIIASQTTEIATMKDLLSRM